MRREETAREFLDGPVAPADLAASLDDVDRLNAWFGGYTLTLREIRLAAARAAPQRSFVVVDVGGGRGDLAVRVARWCRRRRRRARIVVVDRDETSLRLGAATCAGYAEITRVRADATALPIREASADVATASLLLHHLDPDGAAQSLAEMAAASRGAVVVNDLLRAWWSWALVWLTTRLLRCHRFSRHDGPLSVRRAYAPEELRRLAEKAGLTGFRVRPRPLRARVLGMRP
jgi:ubiquinone/menaquinone biosynthesis C-methylase UbiE